MNQKEITSHLKKLFPKLEAQYSVQNLWLFGSFVRAEQTSNSDLDILVAFGDQHISLIDLFNSSNF